jgi:hypothetical protein
MNKYSLDKCFFKNYISETEILEFKVHSEAFNELCDAHFIYILCWLLSTPLVYLCVLFIEKNFCKNKYKRL